MAWERFQMLKQQSDHCIAEGLLLHSWPGWPPCGWGLRRCADEWAVLGDVPRLLVMQSTHAFNSTGQRSRTPCGTFCISQWVVVLGVSPAAMGQAVAFGNRHYPDVLLTSVPCELWVDCFCLAEESIIFAPR